MTDVLWFLDSLVFLGLGIWLGYGAGYDKGMMERDKVWDEMYQRLQRKGQG